MSSKWDRVFKGFCEYQVDGHPEPFNLVSSFYIFFVGFYGLFVSTLKGHSIRFIYSSLMCCGIGSSFLHATGFKFYSQLDAFSMLCVSWYLFYAIYRALVFSIFSRFPAILDRVYDFGNFATTFFILLSLSYKAVRGNPYDVEVNLEEMLILPISGTFIGIVLVRVKFLFNSNYDKMIDRYIVSGILLLACGLTLWMVADPLCQEDSTIVSKYPFLAYFHGIWHITFSHGVYFLIQSCVYMQKLCENSPCSLRTSPKKWQNYFLRIYPLLDN